MSEDLNQLAYDDATGIIDMQCNLAGNDQIPGWNIGLRGWHLPDITLAAIWAKVRKLMRIHGVDAVALFKFDDSEEEPCEMAIIPETSILGNQDVAFAEYTDKLAKVLSTKALAQFAAFLVEHRLSPRTANRLRRLSLYSSHLGSSKASSISPTSPSPSASLCGAKSAKPPSAITRLPPRKPKRLSL